MPGSYRRLVPSLAIGALGAGLALAASVPATANTATTHRASAAHQVTSNHRHGKHLFVRGLVASHHGRSITVFAKTANVGAKTRHNTRITIIFTRSAHGRTKIPVGNHIRLSGTGVASRHTFRLRHNHGETVSPAQATLIFGIVKAVDANLLTVSEKDRDNGDRHDGDDNDGHDRDGDHDGRSPEDHSPGGHGHAGGDNDGRGHRVTVDDTAASITVDGAAGTIAAGETVAVLGEVTDNTVVASAIYAFTTKPGFSRGKVTMVSGENVTFRHDGNTVLVSLTAVPLALNGDVGATPSELVAGDKLLLVGSIDAHTGVITPQLAFAFNHHDDHPCGDNHERGHHGHHGGDGGSDNE
jgi:hypothetical protein